MRKFVIRGVIFLAVLVGIRFAFVWFNDASDGSAGGKVTVNANDDGVKTGDRSNQSRFERKANSKEQNGGPNVQIDFGGVIVDQDGEPLPNATVTINVRKWQYSPLSRWQGAFTRFRLTSDAKGLFSITNLIGDVVTVESVDKNGYKVAPGLLRTYSFKSYAGRRPDVVKPVVIRMWKMGVREDLVRGSRFYTVIPDGRNYTVNLNEGKKEVGVSGGEFVINFNRVSTSSSDVPFYWSFSLFPRAGGILKTNDGFMFKAPGGGYKQSYTFESSMRRPEWTDNVEERFYFTLDDGKVYGSLDVRAIAEYREGSAIRMEYVMNTNGSPNLER